MNLFVIPSWYPTARAPLAGVFIQEQAEAIAELAPAVQVVVSSWPHDSCALSLRQVSQAGQACREYVRSLAHPRVAVKNGVHEIFSPALFWTAGLPFGGVRQLVGVNRANFRIAEQRFGHVDVIHAHVSYPAGYIASLMAAEHRVPYVLTEHMSPFPFPVHLRGGKPRWEIAQAFERAAATIAVSPALADRIASFGFRRPIVVPNLVDERRFRAGGRHTGKVVFFTLGGLTEQKGIVDLLQAIARWNPSAADVEFCIGGDGPGRREYTELATRLGIADRVKWLGTVSREQAPLLFQECDVFVLPSKHETFGVVYAEAIASGKPVIATRCGGAEFIVNEGNGVLVNVGDIGGLANAMQSMARLHRSYSSKQIRQDFLERFSRRSVVPRLVEIYRRAIGQTAAPTTAFSGPGNECRAGEASESGSQCAE